ncbi:MAG TPA: protein kinase [Polyangiaceae bacterium]
MFLVSQAADATNPKACPACAKRYPADALFCSFDGAPLTTSPGAIAAAAATDAYVGREILGHIELRQLVGIGAMGRVYRAFQKGIDRDVAVKILHRELSANQTLVQRFHREAKVASRLAHPNVVHVLLTGQLPDGAMYIVMEYLDGLSLQSALGAAGGAMPLPRALHIALQLCDAAGEAHVQGVVHRDLKPENVMLVTRSDDPDYVKVLDFGIARLNWGDASMATAAGLIFGTARYISPEGAQGEKVGPQGDVYSIATIVYQMLAGRTPFDSDQAVALLVNQIHDEPPDLRGVERASYVPEPIASVVMRNLSKRPEDRAEHARAFGRALLEAAVASGLSAQDLLARPAMLSAGAGSGRTSPATVVQMPSMQRTKQMQLEPDVAARIDAAGGGREAPAKTAYVTPAPGSTEGRVQLKTELPEPEPTPAHSRAQPQRTQAAPTQPPERPQTQPPHTQPPGVATTKWTPGADFEAKLTPPAPPSGVDLTMDDQQAPTTRTRVLAAPPPSRSAVPTSKPPSFVDTTMADESTEILAARREGSGRPLFIVAGCFAAGALIMGLVAYKGGLVGTRSASTQHPSATATAISTATTTLTPTATTTATATPIQVAAMDPGAIPPLAAGPSAAATGSAASVTRSSMDVSNAKPSVGQPVDFVARIAGTHGRTEGARFHFAGPGIAPGTDVSAADDGSGAYRASFTFLQPGKFEVVFGARVDGATTRTARFLVVGDGRSAPAPAPGPTANTPPTPAPAPVASSNAGWL